MSEYIVKGAEPNETVLHRRTPNGYDGWSWLPVREEIVRCRDCSFSLAHGNGCGRNQDIYDAEPDGFCAWGERRAE